MINMQKALHLFWVLIAGLLIAWLLFTTTHPPLPTQKNKDILGTATGLTIHQFDKLGQLHYVGTATHAVEFISHNSILTKVRLTLFDPKHINPPWHTKADKAFVSNGNNKIDLSGNVVFQRKKGPHTHAEKLVTNTLTLLPNTHEANTDDKVAISEPGTANVTTAVGMRANWQLQTAHFLHKVRSTYEPRKVH